MDKVHVLVVEDEAIVSMDLRCKLESLGYGVPAEIRSGEEAVDAASRLRPDVVLMDIGLSGEMDGIDAAEQIRSIFEVPVVYLTAQADVAVLERAKLTEPFGYLLKPVDSKALQTVVELSIYKHEVERRLKESERWLSTVLRSAGDAIVTADRNGDVNLMNPAAESLLGLNKSNALGKQLAGLFTITSQPAFEHPVLRALRDNIMVPIREEICTVIGKGKVISISGAAAPTKDDEDNVTGVVLSIRDVSERKKFERELAEALDKARESDRLKSQLLSTVSHELHTPLAAIKGFATTLLDNGDKLDQWEKQEFLEEIDAASDRLNGLINHLLDFSRLEAGMLPVRPVPTDLNEIVADSLIHFRIRAPQRLISLNIPPDLPEVNGDPRRLREVLDNLLDNVLKYTPAHAQIVIQCEEITEDSRPTVQLCVRDDGPGIPEEMSERVFEPFQQTHESSGRSTSGVGLGLAISRRILDAHHGRIWVESAEGQGAAFYISLPLAPSSTEPCPSRTKLTDESIEPTAGLPQDTDLGFGLRWDD